MIRTLLLLMTLITLFACSSTQKLGGGLPLKAGKTLNYKVTQNTDTEVSIMGMAQKTNGVTTSVNQFDIKDINSKGDITADITVQEMQMEQVTPMMTMRFDSEDPSKNEPEGMLDGMKAMIGHKMTVTVDKDGKVLATKGAKELAAKVTEGNPGGEQIKSLLETQLTSMNGIQGLINFYPKQIVKIGDSWTRTDTVKGQMPMVVNNTYTLKERTNGMSIVTVSGTSKTLEGGGMELQGMKIGYDLSGTTSGTIEINDKTGLLNKGNQLVKMSGKMTMSGGPIGDMSADMKVETDVVTELVK